MGTTTKLYDPTESPLIVGSRQITGFGEGTHIKVSRTEASMTLHTGNDGEQAVTRNRNRSGTVEITLQNASAANDYLSGLMVQHEDSGTGFFSFQVKDLRGATKSSGANCFVEKPAELQRAKEHGETTWKFIVPNLRLFLGGLNGV